MLGSTEAVGPRIAIVLGWRGVFCLTIWPHADETVDSTRKNAKQFIVRGTPYLSFPTVESRVCHTGLIVKPETSARAATESVT